MRYWEIIKEEGLVIPGVNTTPDVQPGEIKRQAAKLGFDLDPNGIPPVWTGLSSKTKAKDTAPKDKNPFYGKNGTPPNKNAPKIINK